jgi:hypothetical protein
MENYIQQSEGARLIKLAHLSIWHLMLININKMFLFTKYRFRYRESHFGPHDD